MAIDKSKQFLVRALQELPQGTTFGEVRNHLNRALKKMEGVESKKQKKNSAPDISQDWNFDIQQGILSGPIVNPHQALATIDKMIEGVKDSLIEPIDDGILSD